MRLPAGAIHQFVPLDTPVFVERFLVHWRPDLALFTESEIWPNLIVQAADAGVPLVLVNARMSARSFQRWAKLRSLSRPVFSRFDLVLAQDGRIGNRLTSLGARRAIVTGNLKYDAPPPPVPPHALADLRARIGRRPVFLAASTHPGEDEIVAEVHRALRQSFPSLLTVIVPRHPERGDAIMRMLAEQGLRAERRSAGESLSDATDVYLGDTIGELGLFYALAPLSFVGGSLIPHGGQNPLEAIKLGSAVLAGPHVFNFAETYHALAASAAYRPVTSGEDLASAAAALFADPEQADAMRERARFTIGRLGGALQKTLDALEPYARGLADPGEPTAMPGLRTPLRADHVA